MTRGGTFERVRYEVVGAVAIVTLARPEKRNALDDLLVEELKHAIADADANGSVHVILLNADGPDFCAGGDLAQLERVAAGMNALENLEDAASLGQLFIAMRNASKPLVAAVQGRALAGGAGLATACDVVIASRDAVFGYPEVHLGFVPAMVMALLRRIVGEKIAFELCALGNQISADEAHRLGLVNRVCNPIGFEQASLDFASDLARRSGSAVSLIKRLLYSESTGFEDAILRGAEVNAVARMTPDCQEGVRRFLEKHGH
jgi:methylglutaconyl-CoA hydratase